MFASRHAARDLPPFSDDLTLGICAKKEGKKRGEAWGILRLPFFAEITPLPRHLLFASLP
jgi:hypothetical protein